MKDDGGHHHNYEISTLYDHMVCEYTGLNILQVGELDILDYLLYRRDAFIYSMNQTEKGQEYLDNAWRITQTGQDRKRMRELFGGHKGV